MSTVAAPSPTRPVPAEKLLDMYHLMLLARRFDEAVIDLYAREKSPASCTCTSGRRQ